MILSLLLSLYTVLFHTPTECVYVYFTFFFTYNWHVSKIKSEFVKK